MRFVILAYPFCARDGFIESAEWDQSSSDRIMPAETCVLHQRRSTGCEIAHRAVTEPPAIGFDIEPLRNRELTSRGLDVAAKIIRGGGDGFWIYDGPTMGQQGVQI